MPHRTVLFLTYPEYGQANTILALCAELLTHNDTELHVSSFSKIQKRVERLQNRSENSSLSTITFHPLHGVPTYEDAVLTRLGRVHPPSSHDASIYRQLDELINPLEPNDHIKVVNQLKATIIQTVPDVVVVDMAFSPGVDACRALHQRYIINSPLPATDIVRQQQPGLRMLWYYPACVSIYARSSLTDESHIDWRLHSPSRSPGTSFHSTST
jgi:UDP:flavonoid glycosyltransferase YjiC (YdhE family)